MGSMKSGCEEVPVPAAATAPKKRGPTAGGEKRVGAKQYRTFLGTSLSSVVHNSAKFRETALHARPSISAELFNPLYSADDGAPVWVKGTMRIHGSTPDTSTPLPPPPHVSFLVDRRPKAPTLPLPQPAESRGEEPWRDVKLEPFGGDDELPIVKTEEDVLAEWINEECAPGWTRDDEVVRRLNEEGEQQEEDAEEGGDEERRLQQQAIIPHDDEDEEMDLG